MMCRPSSASSPASADSTSDSNEPAGPASVNVSSTPTDGASSNDGTPTYPDGPTFAVSENQRGEVLLTAYSRQLTTGGGKPGQGYPMILTGMPTSGRVAEEIAPTLQAQQSKARGGTSSPLVLTSSAAVSPARTSPSPGSEPASRGNGRGSSSSSPGSSGLFDLDGSSLRMYPDSYPATVAEISPSFSRRWPTSGMAWPGACWTLATSESPSDAVECSLSGILEPQVPSRFYLSSKAAAGILRRAERRGRELPSHLSAALEAVARTTTTDKAGDS